MTKVLNIQIIKNSRGHDDLLFEIPELNIRKEFDTYYFALAMASKKKSIQVKHGVAELISFWNKKQAALNNGQTIYLPIDFSDQYTGCLKIEKNNDLKLTYGSSMREGHSVNPINPVYYYQSITDFKPENEKILIVKQKDFKKCLTELIKELEK